MIVLGCDVSTKAIDLVALQLDSDEAQWIHVPLGEGDLLERVRRVRQVVFPAVIENLWLGEILAVGVERPAGRYGTWQVSMAVGGLLQCFPPDMLVTWWMPAEWRKACGLKGNASKEDVFAWSVKRWKWQPGRPLALPTDATDAYCVAWATRQAIRREEDA